MGIDLEDRLRELLSSMKEEIGSDLIRLRRNASPPHTQRRPAPHPYRRSAIPLSAFRETNRA